MNLDDVKSDWKQQHNELANDRFDALASGVVNRTVRLEVGIRRRDLMEAAAAILVAVGSGIVLWFNACPPIMQIGMVIILYRGHSHAINTQFAPIRDELAALVQSLEDDVSESGGM